MRRRLFGESHPDVASSLTHLAILHVAPVSIPTRSHPHATPGQIFHGGAVSHALEDRDRRERRGRRAHRTWSVRAGRPLLTHSYGILSKDVGAPPTYSRLTQRYLDRLREQQSRDHVPHQQTFAALAPDPLVK